MTFFQKIMFEAHLFFCRIALAEILQYFIFKRPSLQVSSFNKSTPALNSGPLFRYGETRNTPDIHRENVLGFNPQQLFGVDESFDHADNYCAAASMVRRTQPPLADNVQYPRNRL